MRVGKQIKIKFGPLKYGNLILVAIDPQPNRYSAIEIRFQEWK
jgi:hypothetical protein